MKNLIYVLIVSFLTLNLQGQNTDSLSDAWQNKSAPDTSRMRSLALLAKSYLKKNPDTVMLLAKQLHQFALQKNDLRFQAASKHLMGQASGRMNDPIKELELYKEELALQKRAGNKPGIVDALVAIAISKSTSSEYMEAIDYDNQAMALSQEINYKKGLMDVSNSLGTINQMLGQYLEAIDYYEKALALGIEMKNVNFQGRTLVNIGNVYNMRGDIEGALKYYRRGRVILEETKDMRNLANVFNNTGTLYMDTKYLDSAEVYLKKGLEIREKMNDMLLVATSLSNLGEVYMKQKRINEAKDCFEKAISISRELGVTAGGITGQLLNLSLLAVENKDLSKARLYSNQALTEAEESGSLVDKVACYESLYRIARLEGNYKESLEWHEKFFSGRDSLVGEEKQQALTEQQFRNEYSKKVAADSLRIQEEKKITNLQMAQQRSLRNYLIVGLICLVGGLVFMINRFIITRKQKRIIEDQKKLVEEKQKEIIDSMHYAKRIQSSLMPSDKLMQRTFERFKKN